MKGSISYDTPSAPTEDDVLPVAAASVIVATTPSGQWATAPAVPVVATVPLDLDTSVIQESLHVSVAGHVGASSARGSDGIDGYQAGAHGTSGTNATEASVGEPAGLLSLSLSVVSSDAVPSEVGSYNGTIAVSYTTTGLVSSSSRSADTICLVPNRVQYHDTHPFLKPAMVVKAVGGAGGRGGTGGNGGSGGRGRAGQNASRRYNATSGGHGGDGGDAGRGTSGAAGGAGGTIEIHVHDADTFALMLVQDCHDPSRLVEGGRGGHAGQHGSPGAGGAGGRGGEGCKYSDGDDTTHKPGGMPGVSGRPGRAETGPLSVGSNGANGLFQINVTNASSVQLYPSRYDVVCRRVELYSEQALPGGNMFQFSDVIDVASFTVANVGAMPTPIEPIQCLIEPDCYITMAEDNQSLIRNRLNPGAQTMVCDRMSFRAVVPDVRTMGVDMKPYHRPMTLRLAGRQLGPNGFACAYHQFDPKGTNMEFRFPIENTKGLVGLSSIETGSSQRISFEIENVSNSDIGAKSSSGRQLHVQFYMNPDSQFNIASEHITLSINGTECQSLQLTGNETLWRGTPFAIDLIKAHGTVVLEGMLTFSSQVAPYSQLGLQVEILLEDLTAPTGVTSQPDSVPRLSPIQRRQLVVASEPTYCPSPYSKAVLVTSSSTTRAQFNAWRDVLTSRLGLSIGYFSVSLYGCLNPDYELSNGTTLRQEFRDKLIVVLDEPFRPLGDGTSEMSPSRMLPNGCMSQSSGFDASTQWLFVASSDSSVDQIAASHFTAPANDVRSFDSVSDYFAAKKSSLEKERSQGAVTDLAILEEKIRVRAGSGSLATTAMKVAKWLEKKDVLRQYVIKTLPEVVKTPKRKFIGWVLVRRGYCRTANTVRVIQRMESHDTSRVLNDSSILFSTVQSLPVATQISLYCKAVRSSTTDVNLRVHVFVHSCLWDLSNFWDGKLDPKGAQCSASFPTLSALLASDEIEAMTKEASNTGKPSTVAQSVSSLVAGLSWVVNSKDLRPWWSPWSKKQAIRRALLSMLDQITAKWKPAVDDTQFLLERAWFAREVNTFLKQGSCLPMPRVGRHWQKGLLHVVTPHEANGAKCRGVAFRLIEHDGNKAHLTRDRSIRPRKQIINDTKYRSLQESAEQQQVETVELFTAIQAARAQATVKTELDVQAVRCTW